MTKEPNEEMSEELEEAQIEEPQSEEITISEAQVERALEKFRLEQNFWAGVVGGGIGACIGAALWALVTIMTGYQVGWMAVGVGFLTGIGVRLLGKGVDAYFGHAGAVLALLGCGLGNLLAICGMVSEQEEIPFFDLLSQLDFEIIKELMVATFSPMDILFYAIGIYEGFKFSIRQLTPEDLAQVIAQDTEVGQEG